MTEARTTSAQATTAAHRGTLRRQAGTGYRWLLMVFLVAGAVQIFLAGLADDHAVYGGLHALDGLLIIAIAAYLLYRATRGPGASPPEGQPDRQPKEAR
jgi:hypothetical protein